MAGRREHTPAPVRVDPGALRDIINLALARFQSEFSLPEPALTVAEFQAEQLATFLSVLSLWRERLSLIAESNVQRIIAGHVIDSLAISPWLESGFRVADLGSGAGFPGIPLAIVRPDCSFVLIEARRKRANFLREVIRQAKLTSNVVVAEGRSEELATARQTPKFDRITVRAVGGDDELLRLARPLLNPTGEIIAMRSADQLQVPRNQVRAIVRYRLADGRDRALTFLRL